MYFFFFNCVFLKLNFIWDKCTWASSAVWKDAFRIYSQPQVTYSASEWYVAKIPLECWLGKSQPAKSQQGRELHDQCILFSYHFLAIIMLPTHSHKPSTLYIVPCNRKLVAFRYWQRKATATYKLLIIEFSLPRP